MRILFINIYVAVVALLTFRAQSSEANDSSESTQSNGEKDQLFALSTDGKKIIKLINKHLNDSLTYLLTSKQYDSQYWERPGMAKYMKELSDKEWEEGLDTLKKYMQRGGKIEHFKGKINVAAKAHFDSSNERKNDDMMTSFRLIHRDSTRKFKMRNSTMSKLCHIDAEICNFLKDGLSKEAERMYELKSYQTITTGLRSSGVGLSLFDASL